MSSYRVMASFHEPYGPSVATSSGPLAKVKDDGDRIPHIHKSGQAWTDGNDWGLPGHIFDR